LHQVGDLSELNIKLQCQKVKEKTVLSDTQTVKLIRSRNLKINSYISIDNIQ
jgi:hypothetical protein